MSIIKQQKSKYHEKRDGVLVSIVEFNFQIYKRNKKSYLAIQFFQILLKVKQSQS